MIGAWPVTWKVSSNRQARIWRTKKNGQCPRRTCCVFTVPPDACGFSANAKRWPGEPKRGRRAPCRTCCTFTVQRDACGVNGIARHWPGEPTKNGDARSRLLRVNRPAGRARGLSRRAAEECYAVALRRAAHAIRTRPGSFGTFFPAMPHACARRTPLYAPCGVRSPAWPRQDGVPPAGLHARAALNRETRENRENREHRSENRLENKRKL